MSKQYLVTLKPLTPFFFGGENTFGDNNVDYYVKSNYLPQQTTLLGMIRYELLAQNGLMGKSHTTAWDTLIGPESFDGNNIAIVEYGAIKSISPLFLTNGKKNLIGNSIDWVKYRIGDSEKKVGKIQVDLSPNEGAMYDSQLQKVASAEVGGSYYDPKHGPAELLVDGAGSTYHQWDYDKKFKKEDLYHNGLFIQQEQIGIHRQLNRKKNESDGAFYKQTSYTLADDYSFAFFIKLDLPPDKKLESRILQMGGERSTFQMNIQLDEERSFESIFNQGTFGEYPKDVAILTSHALAEADIFNYCHFAISDTIPFRNIRTINKGSSNYTNIRGGAIKKEAHNLFLLKQGSVLYCDKMEEVIRCLEKVNFKNIGYNHYVTY